MPTEPNPSETVTVANITPAAPPSEPAKPAAPRRPQVLTRSTPPAKSNQQTLLEDYELPDSTFDADLDSDEPRHQSAAPAAAPDPVQAPAAPPTPTHHPRTLRMAQALEMAPEEIDAYSPADLDAAVAERTIQLARERQFGRATAAADAGGSQPAEAPDGQPAPAQPQRQPDDLAIPAALKEAMDPELLAYVQKLTAAITDLRQLKGAVQGIQQQFIVQANETAAQRFDRHVAAKYAEVLGADRGDPKSPTYRRRMAVIREMGEDKSHTSMESKIDRAFAILFPGAQPATPASQVSPPPASPAANGHARTPEQQAWDAGAVQRPTHRNGAPEPKGVARATRAVAEKLRQIDLDSELGSSELGPEENTLPD